MAVRKAWTGVEVYVAGLDAPTPDTGRTELYMKHARNVEKNLDTLLTKIGNKQRCLNLKG